MATVAPDHSLQLVEHQCELHFSISGFWDQSSMQGFLDEMNQTVLPLMKARKPIYALGDFSDFVPQDRATSDAIGNHVQGAVDFGLKRVAIVNASPLVTLQYKRLSAGLEVEFFDAKSVAIDWLRANRES